MFLNFATGVSRPLGDYYRSVIKNYFVLPGGVDLKMFNPEVVPDQEIVAWKGNSLLIGYAGNTKWYQGLDTVLEAFARVENQRPGLYKLIIIASSLDATVTDFIAQHAIAKSVQLIDKRPHHMIPKLLAAADVLTIVRPSDMVTEHAFPSKFPEYAALGKALVLSKVGDLHSYVTDDQSAFFVDPGNVDQLVQALIRLTDSSLRTRLGAHATKMAREKLDIHIIGTSLYDFLISNAS